jgi:hypothetical protein
MFEVVLGDAVVVKEETLSVGDGLFVQVLIHQAFIHTI